MIDDVSLATVGKVDNVDHIGAGNADADRVEARPVFSSDGSGPRPQLSVTGKLAVLARWLAARYFPADSIPTTGRGRYRFAIGGDDERLAAIVLRDDYPVALARHRDPGDKLFPTPSIGQIWALAGEYCVDRHDVLRAFQRTTMEPADERQAGRVDRSASNRIACKR